MKYSIYQMDVIPGNPEKNRQKVKAWMEQEVAKNNPDTIVLPEMWTTAYTLNDLQKIADHEAEPTKGFLGELSKKLNVNIIGGSVANKVNGKIYNTALVLNRRGELVYQYDKIHLVPMLNEHKYLTGGKKAPDVFELDGVKMGMVICYDLRFPEIIRPLAVQGAEVLHVLAEWPTPRLSHWTPLHIARAIENQLYVVSANRVGSYDGVTFCGTSMVVNPNGDIIVRGTEENEETLQTTMDFDLVKQVRRAVPMFDDRVPHLYPSRF
ncbi:carbon-nitrogen family hydrolase [Oceanobacillus halotolerans]|uniref:carbon-nitrogen family hydrolase n=1 Tax=Oceanobacillus halotolerans TaxID=2663380 RepID=UPI0013D935CC|nr:carbon-nitrogen family hydrolase [Oceanobacillus halotolerans]